MGLLALKETIGLFSLWKSLLGSEPLFEVQDSSPEYLLDYLFFAGMRFFSSFFLMMKLSCSKILDSFSSVQGFSAKKSTP